MSIIAEIQKGLHDKALSDLERAILFRRRAINDAIEPGDIVKFIGTISPKYLAHQEARVLKWLNKNITVELVNKNIGGRFADGPFSCPPSMVVLAKKGDGTVVNDGDDGDDDDGDDLGGLTIRDFKVGDRVITGNIRPSYIANKKGYVAKIRRSKVLVKFDNPPIGTRFEGGVVMRPNRLIKDAK